jgi:hypothetical protein
MITQICRPLRERTSLSTKKFAPVILPLRKATRANVATSIGKIHLIKAQSNTLCLLFNGLEVLVPSVLVMPPPTEYDSFGQELSLDGMVFLLMGFD